QPYRWNSACGAVSSPCSSRLMSMSILGVGSDIKSVGSGRLSPGTFQPGPTLLGGVEAAAVRNRAAFRVGSRSTSSRRTAPPLLRIAELALTTEVRQPRASIVPRLTTPLGSAASPRLTLTE